MAKNIFELNGKAYDALTGAYLGSAKRVQHTATVQAVQPQPVPASTRAHGVSIDGMIAKPSRAAAGHAGHHRQQPAKTLMRHAVKPPAAASLAVPAAAPAAKPLSSAISPLHAPVQKTPQVAAKLSHSVVDPMRARRASQAGRSQSVQHFRSNVRPAGNPYALQDMRRPQAAPVQPMRANAAQKPAAFQPVATPSPADDTAYEQDLFEQALAHATSHEKLAAPAKQAKPQRRRRQLVTIVASFSVFLLLCGVIAYQNRNDIQLQIASAKAGFSAATPMYTPEGYGLGKLAYAPGSVAAIYQHDSKQSFSITQKKSNWDSQTLLENFVATSNEDYKGYQSNGRTVYVYGKNNATWVNGGIWYQLKDDTNTFSDEQIVRIAASM